MAEINSTHPTADEVRKLLKYNPDTGVVSKIEPRNRNEAPYRTVLVFGKPYGEHRVAWLLATGRWPTGVIDHINGDPSDNRLSNLRDVTQKENLQNRVSAQKNNKSSGLLGVTLRKNGKWGARLSVDGKNLHLGYFLSKEQAHEVYLHAKRKHHSGCTI